MCTFCGVYKDLKPKFWVKDWETVKRDIDEASSYGYGFTRAFLADGDVLILPIDDILKIMSYIKQKNPEIKHINMYGNTKAILRKTPEELKALKNAGLDIIYQGIESGNKDVLRRIRKGAFPERMKEASAKIIESGIKLSQTVLLGIGGTDLSFEHARDTGKLLGEYRDWENSWHSIYNGQSKPSMRIDQGKRIITPILINCSIDNTSFNKMTIIRYNSLPDCLRF